MNSLCLNIIKKQYECLNLNASLLMDISKLNFNDTKTQSYWCMMQNAIFAKTFNECVELQIELSKYIAISEVAMLGDKNIEEIIEETMDVINYTIHLSLINGGCSGTLDPTTTYFEDALKSSSGGVIRNFNDAVLMDIDNIPGRFYYPSLIKDTTHQLHIAFQNSPVHWHRKDKVPNRDAVAVALNDIITKMIVLIKVLCRDNNINFSETLNKCNNFVSKIDNYLA